MTLSLAVAGKGGTGKTTLSALMVRTLAAGGLRPVLAVDADPNSCLAEALGVESGLALAEIREQGSSPEGSPASGVGRTRAIDDQLQRAIAEADGFDLVTMGRPEGPRCYCYVNNLLRHSLDSLAKNYAAVVVDNEAGMEHLSRRTTNHVDFLIVVTDATWPAVRAAKRILALSRELPIDVGRRALLVNRVGPGGLEESIRREVDSFDALRLADIPQDNDLQQANATGRAVGDLAAASPAVAAVSRMIQTLR